MSKFNELVNKLREIFQIDRPELDFGIYRILNARANEINDYLNNRLKAKVEQALQANNQELKKQVIEEINEKTAQYQKDGLDPNTVPKIIELKSKLATYEKASEQENQVFSHLLIFFSRYYDSGDFISQRRYKGNTYAIPYAGEEVMLYWANKDQYYTKSGENFANYRFKLADGRTVFFQLITADTAKDNRKDNNEKRFFVLAKKQIVTRLDEEGGEYEEEILPIEPKDQELIIRFEYKAFPKNTKQETLIDEAKEAILANNIIKSRWLDLTHREPTEKNPQRTLLEKHLTNYTTKNTADYFIHKDLGIFLRRELDFYIKNEVMYLDDIQQVDKFADIEKNLSLIKCLRAIALELITFLAQLEDFQKKLWLKKKFVVSSHYCITLDHIPEELYPEIVANPKQWQQWRDLAIWDKSEDGTLVDLKAGLYRMVDTALFNTSFKEKLLVSQENLDEKIDGLLIHSDNFQAISLLSLKYKSKIDGIYIDPPYNTDGAEIIYKNGYKNSSWCSLVNNRVSLSCGFLKKEGILCATIDECEYSNLEKIIQQTMPSYIIRPVIIEYNHRGRVKSNFAITHEYSLWAIPDGKDLISRKNEISDDIRRNLRRTGTDSTRSSSPSLFYGVIVEKESMKIIGVTEPLPLEADIPKNDDPSKVIVWPIDSDGIERRWYYGPTRVLKESREGTVWAKIIKGEYQIHYHQAGKPKMRKSVLVGKKFDASTYGSELLNDIFGVNKVNFSFPKSIHAVVECLESLSNSHYATYFDYFAGSGTTGHAAITLNRRDNGQRKYILVDQGEYFNTVLKPRIQKIVYSSDWKNGKPSAPDTGISHCFKVLKLESYEDTLNNLALVKNEKQLALLDNSSQEVKDSYLLNYMLAMESKGSLLSIENFQKPFSYRLNIATDSAGAYQEQTIDLVETFNYLIGLTVKHIDSQIERGFVTITGVLPTGETALILWRDCELLSYEALNKLCDKLAINPADSEFDIVYINGDHNIPTVLTETLEEGGVTRVLKLRQIESEFLDLMFAVEDI